MKSAYCRKSNQIVAILFAKSNQKHAYRVDWCRFAIGHRCFLTKKAEMGQVNLLKKT
tara:strand:+ start:74 stop:244 length:171 start_codon:yes stop_codon:yes gene_type:complete